MSRQTPAPQRSLIRWLLRPLGEPAFLRLFIEEGDKDYPFLLFEQAFWAIEPDSEHSDEARGEAWSLLKASEARLGQRPVDWFIGIVGLLRDEAARDHEFSQNLQELSRYWSLPELFFAPSPSTVAVEQGYHEIHCHFRGAVPFETLWTGWLSNARWRASLRKEWVEHGAWRRTWAELIQRVAPAGAPRNIARLWFRLSTRALRLNRTRTTAVPYLAACVGLRRTLLCQRTEAGLSLFVKRFERYSRVQKAGRARAGRHSEELVIAVLRKFEEEGAVALELRPTLERTRVELQGKLMQIVRGYLRYLQASNRPVKLGLVLSLFKQEGLRRSGEPPVAIWKQQARLWQSQVAALLEVIQAVPVLRYFVVGLDAAGKERGCPPRVFSSAIDLLHEHHRASGLRNVRPGRKMRIADFTNRTTVGGMNSVAWEPIRLGLTIHAGEDFVDPLTGLRQIAETIDLLGLRRHDRLGHALAASLTRKNMLRMLERRAGNGEVEALDGERFRLLKPRGEHLMDLAWALGEAADDESRRLLAALLSYSATGTFGAPADATRFAAALTGRPHVEAWVPAIRYNEPSGISAEDRVATIVDDAWYTLFERLRRQLLQRIARLGIVVESCPTSNCAVANLDQAPIGAFLEEPDLRVTVATDDPALFGSWPSDELTRLKGDLGSEISQDAIPQLLAANAEASFVR